MSAPTSFNNYFSPHFHKYWLDAPEAGRETVKTALSDIINLLQEDTDLETWQPTHPDLKTALDEAFSTPIETRSAVIQLLQQDVSQLRFSLLVPPIVMTAPWCANYQLDCQSCTLLHLQHATTLEDINTNDTQASLQDSPTKDTNTASYSDKYTNLDKETAALARQIEEKIIDQLEDRFEYMANVLQTWVQQEIASLLSKSLTEDND